jgi:hypothetical protein
LPIRHKARLSLYNGTASAVYLVGKMALGHMSFAQKAKARFRLQHDPAIAVYLVGKMALGHMSFGPKA